MRVLITGGLGYLGSVLVEKLLGRGYDVRVFDLSVAKERSALKIYGHPHFQFVGGDIRDEEAVSEALEGAEAVIHLAAIVGEAACTRDPDMAWQVNWEATCNIVNLCKEKGIKRFIFSSTCSNYGTTEAGTFATEDSPLRAVGLYAETKIKAEEYVLKASNHEFCTSVLRLATLFGLSPRMIFNTLLHDLIRDAVVKRTLIVYGSHAWRPFVHVRDAAEAFLACLEAPIERVSGSAFNVGADSQNYQKGQVAKLIAKHFPDVKLKMVESKAARRDYRVSFERIRRVLGFRTTKTLEDGIIEIKDAIENGSLAIPC